MATFRTWDQRHSDTLSGPEDVGEDVVKSGGDVVKNGGDVVKNGEDVVKNGGDVVKKLNSKERKLVILDILKNNNCATAEELSKILHVSHRTVQRDIDSLKNDKKIHREGSLTDGKWIVD